MSARTAPDRDLRERHCVPCAGDVPPLSGARVEALLRRVPGWTLQDSGKQIFKTWEFKNFKGAIAFVHEVADLAEREGHHPDIQLFSYRRVRLDLSTHAIGGLSENDFILAANINMLRSARP